MPTFTASDADTFSVHGTTFRSYLRSERGATTLAAWRLDVPPSTVGAAHRPDHEEVMLVLRGSLAVTIDNSLAEVVAGDVVHVPTGAELRVDSGPEGASAWVTTTLGLRAMIGEEVMAPPWAQ